jgi:hypothetical protein
VGGAADRRLDTISSSRSTDQRVAAGAAVEVPDGHFLTPATTQVLGVFTASLVLALLVQALDVPVDRPRLRAAGDVATSAMEIVVSIRLWQVFPFRFDQAGFDWTLLVRVLLVLGLVGGAIGVLAGLVGFVRGSGTGGR